MRLLKFLLLTTLIFGLLTSCQRTTDDPEPTEPPQTEPEPQLTSDQDEQETPDPEAGDDEQMSLLEPSEHSRELMDEIRDYLQWDYHAGLDTHFESGHPGDVWVISFANEPGVQAVEEWQIPVPQGVIYVKEEYDADGAEDPFAVTVMEKLSDAPGDWYWLKADPELQLVVEGPDGTALEGTENLGCIDCHGAAADDDYLMAPGLTD